MSDSHTSSVASSVVTMGSMPSQRFTDGSVNPYEAKNMGFHHFEKGSDGRCTKCGKGKSFMYHRADKRVHKALDDWNERHGFNAPPVRVDLSEFAKASHGFQAECKARGCKWKGKTHIGGDGLSGQTKAENELLGHQLKAHGGERRGDVHQLRKSRSQAKVKNPFVLDRDPDPTTDTDLRDAAPPVSSRAALQERIVTGNWPGNYKGKKKRKNNAKNGAWLVKRAKVHKWAIEHFPADGTMTKEIVKDHVGQHHSIEMRRSWDTDPETGSRKWRVTVNHTDDHDFKTADEAHGFVKSIKGKR